MEWARFGHDKFDKEYVDREAFARASMYVVQGHIFNEMADSLTLPKGYELTEGSPFREGKGIGAIIIEGGSSPTANDVILVRVGYGPYQCVDYEIILNDGRYVVQSIGGS